MAIGVTTNYHTIYSPQELNDKLQVLQFAGAYAKLLGENKLYNQLKETFNSLKSQWESHASELCKQKTKTNWLGGGDVYRYVSFCGDFDDSAAKICAEEIMKRFGKQGVIDNLNKCLRKLSLK